ncbi:MAG: pentapeptide repeat-containing protein [Pirellulaceae bacterium]|nr:pentapeptide repeat-containing protein [Planctomycetales bacterium]
MAAQSWNSSTLSAFLLILLLAFTVHGSAPTLLYEDLGTNAQGNSVYLYSVGRDSTSRGSMATELAFSLVGDGHFVESTLLGDPVDTDVFASFADEIADLRGLDYSSSNDTFYYTMYGENTTFEDNNPGNNPFTQSVTNGYWFDKSEKELFLANGSRVFPVGSFEQIPYLQLVVAGDPGSYQIAVNGVIATGGVNYPIDGALPGPPLPPPPPPIGPPPPPPEVPPKLVVDRLGTNSFGNTIYEVLVDYPGDGSVAAELAFTTPAGNKIVDMTYLGLEANDSDTAAIAALIDPTYDPTNDTFYYLTQTVDDAGTKVPAFSTFNPGNNPFTHSVTNGLWMSPSREALFYAVGSQRFDSGMISPVPILQIVVDEQAPAGPDYLSASGILAAGGYQFAVSEELSHAGIYRWDNDQLIEGTKGRVAAPGSTWFALDLTRANFANTTLTNARFISTNLTEARFTQFHGANAQFYGSNLSGADFTSADLTSASINANLSGANLNHANLANASLSGSNLSHVIGLTKEQFYATSTYANRGSDYDLGLDGMKFDGLDLQGWDFSHARMRNVSLEDVPLDETDFSFADLRNATGFVPQDSTTIHNTILPDGHITDVNLENGESLRFEAISGTTITIDGGFQMNPNSSLVLTEWLGSWETPITFAEGVVPDLHGGLVLELFGDQSEYHLFDWPDSLPADAHFAWINLLGNLPYDDVDLGRLYTDGVITVTHTPIPEPCGLALICFGAMLFASGRSQRPRRD